MQKNERSLFLHSYYLQNYSFKMLEPYCYETVFVAHFKNSETLKVLKNHFIIGFDKNLMERRGTKAYFLV